MYRMLIVDDEIEVVEFFFRAFTKESNLPLEVYTAYSAQEALESLEKIRIDIVLSDIKMPKMTGLQMYEVIKKKWSRSKVIFLSGVLEFDYVYASIQNRDVRYLTKLEPTEKIIQTVKEVIEEIELSYKAQYTKLKVQEQMNQAFPLLQNQYLYKTLNGITEPGEALQERLDELDIPLDILDKITLVGGMFDIIPPHLNALEIEKKIYFLKSISNDYLAEDFNVVCYISEQKLFLWILQPKTKINGNWAHSHEVQLNGQLEYIQGACRENLGTTISFAYSNEPVDFSKISEEYINIKKAVGYKGGLTSDSVIVSSSGFNKCNRLWDEPLTIDSSKQLMRLNMLEGYLELNQEEEFFKLLSVITDCLKKIKSRNYGPALEVYYSVSTMLMKHINFWNLNEKLAFRIELYKLMRADQHDSWAEAVQYLHRLSGELFSVRFSNEADFITDAVLHIQKYILENLDKDLSLITLADRVRLNPSYLSRLFKEKTEINLYDYILEMRMAKAKEMLKRSGTKIHEIASLVGYESAQSFTRVFRKYAGLSPSEYRGEQ